MDKTDLTYRYSMELSSAKTLRSLLMGISRYLQFVFTFMLSVAKTASLPVIPVFLRYRVLPLSVKRIDTLLQSCASFG